MRLLLLTGSLLVAILFVTGCDNSTETPPPTNRLPGQWRWPEAIGSDSIQYGEQINIPAGTFTMGWGASEPTPGNTAMTRPVSSVSVSGFWMDKYEVTNFAVRSYVNDANPHDTLRPKDFIENPNSGFFDWYSIDSMSNYAVQPISWWGAIYYANWRSRLEGLDVAYTIYDSAGHQYVRWDQTKNGYRLPTEAEWEYAARGPNAYHFSWGNDSIFSALQSRARAAFYALNASQYSMTFEQRYQITFGPIGRFRPRSSRFGIGVGHYGQFDMTGNVEEWVWDWYGTYTSAAKTNPTGPESGTEKVVRGGNMFRFLDPLERQYFLNYDRYHRLPGNRNQAGGFRLVRNL